MKHRKLRIAWSVAWGIVAVLLIALWVRSYSVERYLQIPNSQAQSGVDRVPRTENLCARLDKHYSGRLDSNGGQAFEAAIASIATHVFHGDLGSAFGWTLTMQGLPYFSISDWLLIFCGQQPLPLPAHGCAGQAVSPSALS